VQSNAWHKRMVFSLGWSLTDLRSPWSAAALCALLAVLAALLALAPVSLAGLLLAGIALALLVLARPALGLAALALAVPFGSLREIVIGPANVGVAELLGLWTLAAWAAHMAAERRLRVAGSRLWLALALLLGAMLLSVTQALSLGHSIKELAKWLEFAGVAVCAATLAAPAERRLILSATLLAGSGAGLLGWYQFLAGVGPPGFLLFGRFMRAYGAFRQPNPYAGYLGLVLPVALSLLIAYWPWRAGRPWADRVLWLLALAAALTTAPAIIMSWSRGAWFGAAAGLLVVLLGRSRRFAVIAVVLGAALAGVIFVGSFDRAVPAVLSTRLTDFADYFTFRDVSAIKPNPTTWAVIERMAHWQAALRMFADRPWLGVGIGNYEAVYAAYRLPRWLDPLGHAHNYYLNIAAEAGILGLLAYVLFWLGACALAVRVARRLAGPWRGATLGILAALIHLSVHNLFDNLYVQGIYLQVALWIGLLVALSHPLHPRNGLA